MNALLDKAMKVIARLPDAEQEAIARELLERVEADERWEALLGDQRSKAAMKRLAAEARAEIERGDVIDADPTSRR